MCGRAVPAVEDGSFGAQRYKCMSAQCWLQVSSQNRCGLCNLGFSIIGHAGCSAPVGLTISGMGEKGIERINVLGFVMVEVWC